MFHNAHVGGMNKQETEINVKRKKIPKVETLRRRSLDREVIARKVKQLSVCEEDKMILAGRKDSSNMK